MFCLFGCWQNVSGLNAVCVYVGTITCMRVCVYACKCVLSIIYINRRTDGQTDQNTPNVKQNIIELMKVKVLAQSQKRL